MLDKDWLVYIVCIEKSGDNRVLVIASAFTITYTALLANALYNHEMKGLLNKFFSLTVE